jgi:hypothetical protein
MKIQLTLFVFILASISFQLKAKSGRVPGTVVNYIPASSGMYIGSPGIAVLPDGGYVASNDFFGPASTEDREGVTVVFGSSDKGESWKKIAEIKGQFWSNLFVHKGLLYIMGTSKHNGNIVIRRSMDGGVHWSEPTNSANGLLFKGEYHTAPVPMVLFGGKLCRAFEFAVPNVNGKGTHLGPLMISVPADADLLNASNWKASNFLTGDTSWMKGIFRGWLEGNAVVTADGRLVDFLRVETSAPGTDMAAIVEISDDCKKATFDPATGFLEFSGGARKFSIRYDEQSKRYWTITNLIADEFVSFPAGNVRNTLVLKSSEDLWNWSVKKTLLKHPDVYRHGFQYIDWQFDGNDIIFLSRTAWDDEFGGADSFHNANYLTFHRIKNFRKLAK